MEEKKLTDEEIAKAILQQVEYNAGIPYIDEWLKVKTVKFADILNFIYRLQNTEKANEEAWLKLKRIGLNNPTEVEYNEKSLVTVGLDIKTLVKTWRDTFDLKGHDIYLEASKELIRKISGRTIGAIKSVKELLEEERVFLREVE